MDLPSSVGMETDLDIAGDTHDTALVLSLYKLYKQCGVFKKPRFINTATENANYGPKITSRPLHQLSRVYPHRWAPARQPPLGALGVEFGQNKSRQQPLDKSAG